MFKKKLLVISILTLSLIFMISCGSSDVQEVEKVVENKEVDEVSAEISEDATEEVEQSVFILGDTVTVDNLYSITILGVTETDERNEYSDKEVSQVLIIDYMYENLASDDEDIYITDSNFKFIDEHGNMCDTYPVGGEFSPIHTPLGAKAFASMTIGTVDQSNTVKLHYYDNMFDSKSVFEYDLVVGESIEADFSGELPVYDNVFKLGEEVEVTTSEGKYTVKLNSVVKSDKRNQFSDKNPSAVYIIDYTYQNNSIEDNIYISDSNFKIIDSNGNMGFTYPASTSKYPQETIKGAKTTADMAFGTHIDGNSVILCFSDNMFSDKADFYYLITDIN